MRKGLFRKTSKTILVILNCFIVFLLLLSCLNPWLNPTTYWWIGFIGLLVPYLVLILIFTIIFWLMVNARLALISVVGLLIGWQQISLIFAFHPKEGFSNIKYRKGIRIIDWNVRSFNGLTKNKETKKHIREDVASTLIKLNPDIICLQEFNTSNYTGIQSDNLSLFINDYPYYYFSKDYHRNKGNYYSGSIIFSKYPMIDSGKIKFLIAESVIYSDIVKGTDTFRIYTTHLQSFKFKKEDYEDIEKIKDQEDESLIASRNIFYKMKLAFSRRSRQVVTVKENLDKSPYPSVICGDFNDIPNSFTYAHIKGDWQDAFLQKGFGIGRSFITMAPTLRIDYILPDNHFDILQFDMVDEDLSDHIMLVTDVRLKK